MRQFHLSNKKFRVLKAVDHIVDEAAQWVILFHGFGADAYDLSQLNDVLRTPKPTNWLFPQGPLEVPIGPGWTGRAWWPINVEDLQRRAQQGSIVDLSEEKPAGLFDVRPAIFEMINQLGVSWDKVILGGFSQGAMCATDIFLNAPQTPRGLILFSGALINKAEWAPLAKNRIGAKYFISHGKSDPVLPFRCGQQLESVLNNGGMKGKMLSFEGGHEIPPAALTAAIHYLKEVAL